MTIRRFTVLAGGAAVALAALHIAAWFVIADRLRSGIDRWTVDRRAEGWTVEHGALSISGFPLTWRARIESPRLAQSVRRPAFLWAGPAFDMAWRPWDAQRVDFRTAGTHRLGIGTTEETRAAPITMSAATGHLVFAPDGRVRKLAFRVDEASLPARNNATLRIGRIDSIFDAPPSTVEAQTDELHLSASVRLDATLTGVILPAEPRPVLGRTIETVGLRGAVLGTPPPGSIRETLSRWRDDGGTLEIERLALDWATLRLRADGTMALDRSLQPVGALTATVAGYDETMDRLVASGLVRPGEALLAKFALGALARPPANGGPPEIKVPISIQEGWIYLGPVKLLPAPIVHWD